MAVRQSYDGARGRVSAAMARIFISHSSRDNAAADTLKAWLNTQGFDHLFLDIDKHAGIQVGTNWERTLYGEIDRAQAVLLILTPNWLPAC